MVVLSPSDRAQWVLGLLHGAPPDPRDGRQKVAVERYLVVPSLRNPAIIVPDWRPGMAKRVLVSDSALRRRSSRTLRRALAVATEVPAMRRLVAASLVVDAAEPEKALLDHLRHVVGRVVRHVAVGSVRGERQIPVIQLFDDDGGCIGFVKVGADESSAERVRTEAEALQRCAKADPIHFVVPRVLYHGRWRQLELLVTAPLPPGIRRLHRRSPLPPLRVTLEVAGLTGTHRGSLASSSYLLDLSRRAMALPRLSALVEETLRDMGGQLLDFGSWHGDWVSWNLGWAGDGRLVAWDWEHWAPGVPLGFDPMLFLFGRLRWLGRLPMLAAFERAARESRLSRRALGQPPGAETVVEALFLMEMLVREVERGRSVAAQVPRIDEAVRVLLRDT
jgi:hypothetical protein